jgi:hypothetical protein
MKKSVWLKGAVSSPRCWVRCAQLGPDCLSATIQRILVSTAFD